MIRHQSLAILTVLMGLYGSPQLWPTAEQPAPGQPAPGRRRGFWAGLLVGAAGTLAIGLLLPRGLAVLVGMELGAQLPPSALVDDPTASPSGTPPSTVDPTATPAPTTPDCPEGVAACGSFQGVTVLVSDIDRDYQPEVPSWAAELAVPRHGFHWLRLEVTMEVEEGQHDLSPFGFNVKDAVGQNFPDPIIEDPRCEAPTGGIYNAGEQLGPMPLCVQVADPTDGPLTLIWFPTDQTGLQPVLTIELP